jgi:AhpD family alkylhydroperoxidase
MKMTIEMKEKELIAVGLSVASGCMPCTNYHVTKAREEGAKDEDIVKTIEEVIVLRNTATAIMENHALSRLDKSLKPVAQDNGAKNAPRIAHLLSLGVAYVLSCTTTLKNSLSTAEAAGICEEDIAEVINLAAFIKDKGHSHVLKLSEKFLPADAKEEGAMKSMMGGFREKIACCAG